MLMLEAGEAGASTAARSVTRWPPARSAPMATSSEPRPFRESTTEEVGLSTKRQLLKWKRMFADDTDDSWVADEHHASFGVHKVFCWVCRNAGVNNTFSKGVTTSEVDTRRLSQHAKTQMHKDAMDACEQAKRAPG